ncbi:hypothetical protein BLNAU_18217 [Blattamonas nauphoetae]|uniref:Uncharacterized protein n=1 Tax=Blattamonas nauphoetae TaxID=2049346 RepID=A0ABQ9X684_9EUKA|nr:hypothetical protein BLNAU_18217 [Blattamonas nauphoetae]
MSSIENKTDSSSSTAHSDCSAFLNWQSNREESVNEKAIVFRSLVATVKFQPSFDVSLEAQAVKFLESVDPMSQYSAETFLSGLGLTTDESLTNFKQSLVVLISSASQVITVAAMKMLFSQIFWCSTKVRLALAKAGLIPHLMNTLNSLSLPLTEAVDIHLNVMKIINKCLCLATPEGLVYLEIEDRDEQQPVHETVLKQVIVPSEPYIWHLCMNRYSIIDGDQSAHFVDLLHTLLDISPYYQPTMDVVVSMPVLLTIPSCLTSIEKDHSIWYFVSDMNNTQRKWNRARGDVRQMSKKIYRMLRMEGMEDVIEEKLRNDKDKSFGGGIVGYSIQWNNLQGMNAPLHR